ncbi:AAA family ATPase [candidate division WOR-3 bacterium]|nr:AAA family ATPase [candidate division WOR-3 bacterium]
MKTIRKTENDAVDIRELVNVFLRRHKLFIYVAVPVFLGIIIAQFTRPFTPLYRATFDIGITKERPVEGFFSTGMSETPTVQIGAVTQRAIASLLSVNLAEKVADTLGLYAHVKNANSDFAVEARIKYDFAKSIGPLRLRIADGMFTLHQDGEKIHEGPLNQFVDLGLYELKVTALRPQLEHKSYEMTVYPRERLAVALRNSLAIKVLEADKVEQELGAEKVPFSGEGASKKLVTAKSIFPGMNLIGILRIDVHWSNREDALRIASALSEQLIIQDVGEKSRQFTQSEVFIDSQLVLYQNKLTQIEEEMRLFKELKKISDLRASTQALINQVSTLESKRNQLEIEQKILIQLAGYLAESTPEEGEIPNFAGVLISSTVLQNFYGQLLDAEAALKSRLKEYSSNHPKVMEIRAKLGGLKEQMQVEITKRIPSIRSEIASVQNQIASLQAKLQNVPEDEISLARLERDRETAEKLYTFFAEKLEETRVQEAGVTSDLKVINPPIVAAGPVNPRRPALILFLSMVIATLAAGFAVFIAEYIDNTAKDPEKVAQDTGLPIFAAIPVIGENLVEQKKLNLWQHIAGFFMGLVPRRNDRHGDITLISSDVSSPEFEAFRKLSMNLDFAHPEKSYRLLYVTSAGPEEGKTFVAINTGLVLATLGKKVLLVDTDFRKKTGNLTNLAKFSEKKGLFNVLKGETQLTDVLIPFTPDNANTQSPETSPALSNAPCSVRHALCMVPIGSIPPNPFVFLESDRMRNLLQEFAGQYDYVIVDGVPILLFADAAYLANFTDGVLLTIRYGKTDMKELQNAKNVLETAKSSIIGVVMNSVPRTRGSYYYQYYHKYYAKYYKKGV